MSNAQDSIRKALLIFRASQDLQDEPLIEKLIAGGFEPTLATRLVEFLPIAYFRIMVEGSGAQFSEDFERDLPGGTVVVHPFDSEPLWNDLLASARFERKSGVSAQDYLAIAARSAECDAANQALNAGNTIDALVFGRPRFVP